MADASVCIRDDAVTCGGACRTPARVPIERLIADVMVGVPVILGRNGVEKIVEIKLTDDEKKALAASAGHVKESLTKVKL